MISNATRYGLVTAMTGITCAAIQCTTWDVETRGLITFLVVLGASCLAALAIQVKDES